MKKYCLILPFAIFLFGLTPAMAQSLPDQWSISQDGHMLQLGKKAPTGLYDSATIQSVYLTFPQANYWQQLTSNYNAHTDLLASMTVGGTVYDSVGVRFKGQTSYMNVSSQKKSFNITMDFIKPAQRLMGFQTLNFNNSYEDPSFLREVFYLHQIQKHIPAAKANFVHLYINNQDWGLYPNVQQLNKEYLKEWYLSNDGAQWRADYTSTTPGPGPGGWGDGTAALNYLGADTNLYKTKYTLKSNDIVTQPWSRLVTVCDKLNNSGANLLTVLPQYMDIDRTLWFLACEVAFADDDSYIYKGKMDYYVYYEPETGRLVPHEFDGNSAFFTSAVNWGAFYNAANANYPLLNKMLAVPAWRQRYLAHMRTILSESFNPAVCTPMLDHYKTQIDALVQSDPKKIYTYNQFTNEVTAIKNFINTRRNNLLANTEVAQAAPAIQYALSRNAANSAWATPAAGEAVKIHTRITAASGLSKVTMYYSTAYVGNFTPVQMWDDGAHDDSASADGVYGGAVPGQPAGTAVRWYVEATAANSALSVSYLPTGAEHDVYYFQVSNPLAGDSSVVINEVMASNSSVVKDNYNEYDDWVELYNRGTATVNVGGWYLTDNPANPDKWQIAAGTTIPAGGYLTFWADEDSSQGTNHMNFKLSGDGESVTLLNAAEQVVNTVSFGMQVTDQSYARIPNGTGPFVIKAATFGSNNEATTAVMPVVFTSSTFRVYPNPARNVLTIETGAAEASAIEVRSVNGSLVYTGTVTGKLDVAIDSWADGIYFVRCGSGTARLVVRH